MHNILEKVIPHILVLTVLLFLPPKIAVYVFIALYIWGVFINAKKEKDRAAEKNKNTEALWWEVLGTEPTASISDCARLRKLLTKIYHPDGGQAPNEAAMRRINKAFETRAEEPDSPETGHIH